MAKKTDDLKITDEELQIIQEKVNQINNLQMQVGGLEVQKATVLGLLRQAQAELGKTQEMLEEKYVDNQDPHAAFKLAYWFENFSPEIDLEKSYLWYSVSVSSGNYKAMKFRDRVGELLENDVILDLQKEAFDIFTKQKYLDTKNKSGEES